MRVYLSTDMEGTAGVVDWSQCRPTPGGDYEHYRNLLQAETNAAIDGAATAGATTFLVNDSHGRMHNLRPDQLHHHAAYLAGFHKPHYMMEGLDNTFDAIFLIAYHGSAAADHAVLPHTYNPHAIAEVHLNGQPTGEAGINALAALHHHVPIVLITGDQTTATETLAFTPHTHTAVVKNSLTGHAATNLHPEQARQLIHDTARRAIETLGEAQPPHITLPATLDIRFHTAELAAMATWLHGVTRTGPATVQTSDEEPLRLYRTFLTIVALTRSIIEP
jgi:D-amino peptidase